MSENPILWQPSEERVSNTAMTRFMHINGFDSYDELHRWSVSSIEEFWLSLCAFCDVRLGGEAEAVLSQPGDMMSATWFDGATLNFAEHLLRHEGARAAIVFRGENGARRQISFDELRQQVADIAAGLRARGVGKGRQSSRVPAELP